MAGRCDQMPPPGERPNSRSELPPDHFGCNQIEMAAAGILEESDVGGRAAPGDAPADEIIEIAEHIGFGDGAAGDRLENVADAGKGRFPPIDKDARAPD